MLKRFTYLTLLMIFAILIGSCDNDDFVSPHDITSTVSQPTKLQITQESVSSIKLIWEDNSLGEEGFIISRKKDNDEWVKEYALVGENVEEYVDSSILPNGNYEYRIMAYYGAISSSYIENNINTQIPVPSNLQLAQLSASSLKLTWEDNYQWEEGYRISRKKDDEAWVEEYALVGENVEEYVDSSILPNGNFIITKYLVIIVKAINILGLFILIVGHLLWVILEGKDKLTNFQLIK